VRSQIPATTAPTPSPTTSATTVSISTPPGAWVVRGGAAAAHIRHPRLARDPVRCCVALGRRALHRAHAVRPVLREVGGRLGHDFNELGMTRLQGKSG
jgi:hypothetical protein